MLVPPPHSMATMGTAETEPPPGGHSDLPTSHTCAGTEGHCQALLPPNCPPFQPPPVPLAVLAQS